MKKIALILSLLALLTAVIIQQQPSNTLQTLPTLPHYALADVAYIHMSQAGDTIVEGKKEGSTWLSVASPKVEIQAVVMGQLLADLHNMRVKRVASNNVANHARFAVSASGSHVLLKDNADNTLLDVYIGKPATDLRSTYIRLGAENTVMTVDKTLTWQVKRIPDAWLVKENPVEEQQ